VSSRAATKKDAVLAVFEVLEEQGVVEKEALRTVVESRHREQAQDTQCKQAHKQAQDTQWSVRHRTHNASFSQPLVRRRLIG
jgi:SOS response regulatory protein OraA/RecX